MMSWMSAASLAATFVPEAELAAGRLWFDATVLQSALQLCSQAFPAQADMFARHAEAWLERHAPAMKRGEESFRAEAGDAVDAEAFDTHGARRQFSELLAGYPIERRREWCAAQLQFEDGLGGD